MKEDLRRFHSIFRSGSATIEIALEEPVRPDAPKSEITFEEFRKLYYSTFRFGTASIKLFLNSKKHTDAEKLKMIEEFIGRVDNKINELEYGA